MLDNVSLNKFSLTSGEYHMLEKRFKGQTRETRTDNVVHKHTMKFGSLTISFSQTMLNISGSITKFYFRNNVEQLSFVQLHHAVSQLEEYLNLGLADCILSKAEFAFNFGLSHKPEVYVPIFGKHSRLGLPTVSHGSTVYFEHNSRRLKFYNKGNDAIAKKMDYPDVLQPMNIGRIELTFKSKMKRQIGFNTLGELLEKENYSALVDYWYNDYLTIHKLSEFNKEWGFSSLSQMVNYGFNEWCNSKGYSYVYSAIEQENHKGNITNGRMASRMKSRLNKAFSDSTDAQQGNLIEEMDNCVKYCFKEAKIQLMRA
ncbi:hypothetical protein O3Q51_07785 [Cryomorphaceae bacterium 1068]|nr:hypothetical protein [Cryomorphaceae bacterium 1068]